MTDHSKNQQEKIVRFTGDSTESLPPSSLRIPMPKVKPPKDSSSKGTQNNNQ